MRLRQNNVRDIPKKLISSPQHLVATLLYELTHAAIVLEEEPVLHIYAIGFSYMPCVSDHLKRTTFHFGRVTINLNPWEEL